MGPNNSQRLLRSSGPVPGGGAASDGTMRTDGVGGPVLTVAPGIGVSKSNRQ
jgi:hypothetical protein